jgi:hypothetical protein
MAHEELMSQDRRRELRTVISELPMEDRELLRDAIRDPLKLSALRHLLELMRIRDRNEALARARDALAPDAQKTVAAKLLDKRLGRYLAVGAPRSTPLEREILAPLAILTDGKGLRWRAITDGLDATASLQPTPPVTATRPCEDDAIIDARCEKD